MAVLEPASESTIFAAPQIVGILNVTPDSFSDGGDFDQLDKAVGYAQQMVAAGASIIDVGGESARPGAVVVSSQVQIARVVPVIDKLRSVIAADIRISIDARDPEVAARALQAGASIINDISGGQNQEMLDLAATTDAAIILMHMQGSPETMQQIPHYVDVVAEIIEFLSRQAAKALSAGVPPDKVVVDPGIGFGKSRQHNLQLLRRLREIVDLGYPVMLGTSRKRFMGAICQETEFKELVGATCATTALGVYAGVKLFRVHDIRENRQAMEVALATLSDTVK